MDLEKFEHAITKYGTPLYVFDIDEVKRKTDYFRDRFRESAGLCFAIKANPFSDMYNVESHMTELKYVLWVNLRFVENCR